MDKIDIVSSEPLTNEERLMLYEANGSEFEQHTGLVKQTLYRARQKGANLEYGTLVKIRTFLQSKKSA